MQTESEFVSHVATMLGGSSVLIVGPFLLMPDECERRRAYRLLNIRPDDMRRIDRAVVREIVATVKGDRLALGPFCN